MTALLHALLFVVPAALAGGALTRLAGHRHTLTARATTALTALRGGRHARPITRPTPLRRHAQGRHRDPRKAAAA